MARIDIPNLRASKNCLACGESRYLISDRQVYCRKYDANVLENHVCDSFNDSTEETHHGKD